ncbi:glycyl-radical enzyme activating protein [Candidatus Binatia bacterium]|nr:glycyl-radical enzyme activating protein [Candidatus Binatia bacterium]
MNLLQRPAGSPASCADDSAAPGGSPAAPVATVFDIQRFSIHDGPGIRTVIFFKGCSLACSWCQNPEAIRPRPEMAYYEDRCIPGCSACRDACPEHALGAERKGRLDFSRCTVCGLCVPACPADALRIVGSEITVAALLEAVLRDRPFYEASGGGVTLSGGEPVLHAPFLREFLPAARAAGLHIVIETAGCYPPRLLDDLLPFLDAVLFDLKVVDAEAHRRFTTRDNAPIIGNLEQILRGPVPVTVRMPVVPGYNTAAADIAAAAALLRRLGVRELTLLRYNHLWEAKLPRLDGARAPLGVSPPPDGLYEELVAEFASHGIRAAL